MLDPNQFRLQEVMSTPSQTRNLLLAETAGVAAVLIAQGADVDEAARLRADDLVVAQRMLQFGADPTRLLLSTRNVDVATEALRHAADVHALTDLARTDPRAMDLSMRLLGQRDGAYERGVELAETPETLDVVLRHHSATWEQQVALIQDRAERPGDLLVMLRHGFDPSEIYDWSYDETVCARAVEILGFTPG